MKRRAYGAFAALIVLAGIPSTISGQTLPTPENDRFEISVGGVWIGGADLGSESADLRANNLTPTPFRLFATDSSAASAPGFDARIAYWLTRSIGIEGQFLRARPELRTRISADAEQAGDLTAAERLDQYFVDVGGVWLLNRLRILGHTVPFVSGGAGYLRQLHDGRTLIETGQVYYVGGGVRHQLLTDAWWFHAVGVKLDARLYMLANGVELEDRVGKHGAISGFIYLAF